MKISKGIKKINPTDEEKSPLILVMQDTRKIIITKNKKKIDGIEKTYYSYQLNIPRDYLMLIQDDYELIEKTQFTMYFLEINKQHYVIKIVPYGVQNIYSIPNVYGYIGSGDFIQKMQKKANITKEQINQIIEIITSETIRDKDKIVSQISQKLEIKRDKAEKIYDTFLQVESKLKKNVQFTLPKKDMPYLQAYDKYQEIVQNVNDKNEKYNNMIKADNDEDEPIFKIPPLYADMYFMQKFNVNGLYFEYELHININVDVDKSFVKYVENDVSNPGGIPGWLETLLIDWSDPIVQNHLGIISVTRDYDLTDYGMDKYKIEKIDKKI